MGNFLSKSLERKSDSASSSAYTLHKHGRPRTAEFRVFFEKDGVPLSPFHDIPLHADEEKQVFNMVVEVPRWTNAKYEVRALTPRSQSGTWRSLGDTDGSFSNV
jgi:inorganic pyrophosphatase